MKKQRNHKILLWILFSVILALMLALVDFSGSEEAADAESGALAGAVSVCAGAVPGEGQAVFF